MAFKSLAARHCLNKCRRTLPGQLEAVTAQCHFNALKSPQRGWAEGRPWIVLAGRLSVVPTVDPSPARSETGFARYLPVSRWTPFALPYRGSVRNLTRAGSS